MTDMVNLYAAKTNLSKLVERAAAGEEIVIAKAGKPKAKLVPYQPSQKKASISAEPPRNPLHRRRFRRAPPTRAAKVLRVGWCGC